MATGIVCVIQLISIYNTEMIVTPWKEVHPENQQLRTLQQQVSEKLYLHTFWKSDQYHIIFRSNKLCSYCSVISHGTDIKKISISKTRLSSQDIIKKVSNEYQWDIENDDWIYFEIETEFECFHVNTKSKLPLSLRHTNPPGSVNPEELSAKQLLLWLGIYYRKS